ncbi:MAG: flagellar biosynthesis protein FlhB [Bacteroidales bacterium]|nr:flagellar biosynthesis protein FlhB [Candidatus Latescibacterota bacterium]
MAESSGAGEKTESASPKRRREARDKGQVARSQEVNSLIILATGTMLLLGLHGHIVSGIEHIFRSSFNTSPATVEIANIVSIAKGLFSSFFSIVLPVFLGIIVAGLGVNLSQVGFHVTTNVLTPKLERINPLEGFKRIFSWKSVIETMKGLIKIGVISYIAYRGLRPTIDRILALSMSSSPDLIGTYLQVALIVVVRALVVMVIVAALDYAFQYWQHEKSIKMTLKEVKDELKETEGDPLVRERVRSIQREMSRRRMMEDVKTADAVITNPTSFAIAIKYSQGMQSPKVVAKGRKLLAEKIKKIALENGVAIVENKPLARALYKACKIGGFVPVHLFKAVAEILAYVYSLKDKNRR